MPFPGVYDLDVLGSAEFKHRPAAEACEVALTSMTSIITGKRVDC